MAGDTSKTTGGANPKRYSGKKATYVKQGQTTGTRYGQNPDVRVSNKAK